MILDNPFHVLGLPADCTPRELTRRQAQTAAYLNVGHKLEFDGDISFSGASRNASTVERANRELQDAARRVQHGLFWFTRSGTLDRHGLAYLTQGRFRDAFQLFEHLEDQAHLSPGTISTVNNFGSLCVLLGLMGTWKSGSRPMTEEKRCGLIVRGLKAKARVLGTSSPEVLKSYVAGIGGELVSRDTPAVIRRFGESLKDFTAELDRHGIDCPTPRIVNALKAGGPRLVDVIKPLTQAARRKIEDLIRECRDARRASAPDALGAVKKMHDAVSGLLREVEATAGPHDPVYMATADRAAEELVDATIAGINHHQEADDLTPRKLAIALEAVEQAAAVAAGPRMRARTDEVLGQARQLSEQMVRAEAMASVRTPLFEWQREISAAREQLHGSKLLAYVGTSVGTASALLAALRRAGLRHVGPEFLGDELVEAGSMVCSQLVGSLVMAMNEASESRWDSIDIVAAHSVMYRIVRMFGGAKSGQTSAGAFPVKSDVHLHMMTNSAIIESLRGGRGGLVTKSGSSGTGTGCLIAGLVAAGVLVAVWAGGRSDGSSPASRPSLAQLEFSRPAAGGNNVLSVTEIRWCLREDIRIEALRGRAVSDPQIDRFNRIVSDYNRRCGSFRYRPGVLGRAQREIETVRTEIVSAARRSSSALLGSPQ
ncbi:hypothetical protein [Candidatus Palauibacter sp.]|uniref:hypothetical protein n=1 Tax=Candidatus Palauibacter sp. TaxID=3101350 RepID=UPI003B52892F